MDRSKSESEKQKIVFTIEFSEEAEADIQKIFDWYEEQRIGLGDDFIEEVEKAMEVILQQPLSYQKLGRGLRKVKPKRFPYGIYYRMNKSIVKVIAVLHLKRHSKIIGRRNRK